MLSYGLATFVSTCFMSAVISRMSTVDGAAMMTSLACRQTCNCSAANATAYYSISCLTSDACLPFDVVAHTQSIQFVATGIPIVGGWTCESPWLPLLLFELDVSRNGISDVVSWRTVANSLHNLSVARNNLTHVTMTTFARLVRLRYLDVSDNDVADLESGCFRHLRRLKTLNLANNKVEHLQHGVFDGLSSLTELRLDSNRLISLGHGLLGSLNKLAFLSASGNRLPAIDCWSFDGSPRISLQQLNLANNLLDDFNANVTPALACLQHLQTLTLDGNPTRQLRAGDDGRTVTVRWLSISHMPRLIAVDRGAFALFTQLDTLTMSDNPQLRYIDQHALPTGNILRTLYLHNNNLTSVPVRIMSSLNRLTLSSNPLHCDCHLHWMSTEQCSVCDQLLADNGTVCASPASAAGLVLIQGLNSNSSSTLCGPLVIGLFDSVIYLPIGSSLSLDCRVVQPSNEMFSVTWITPVRHRRPSTQIQVEHSVTGSMLSVRHLESRDAGTYRCLAVDDTSNYSSSASTGLRLYNVDARILPINVGTNSVTITWSGTDSTIAAADYSIVYRLFPVAEQWALNTNNLTVHGANSSNTIHLRPYLRKYTVIGLRPMRTYEFCMTTEVANRDRMYLHCMQLTTKPEVNSSKTPTVSRVQQAACVMAMLTVMVLVVRCVFTWRRRHYQQPGRMRTGACRSSSALSLDQLTSHLANADDEHIMSSRTSLIRTVN